MIRLSMTQFLSTLALLALPFAATAQHADHVEHTEQAEAKRIGDPYPLGTCPVSGGKLGSMGDPVVKVYDGREVRFCCSGCAPKFEENAEQYWQKIDAQIIEQQKDDYPLETCLISGEKMGGTMGEPIDYVYGNRLIRFCCSGCVKDFQAEPEKYLLKLNTTIIEQQKDHYPLNTCVVSGDPLGGDAMGEPINAVYANQLVRFCCKDCVKGFEKNPAHYLMKIEEARDATVKANAPAASTSGNDRQSDGQSHMHH